MKETLSIDANHKAVENLKKSKQTLENILKNDEEMDEQEVSNSQALNFLHRIRRNQIRKMEIGKAKGKIEEVAYSTRRKTDDEEKMELGEDIQWSQLEDKEIVYAIASSMAHTWQIDSSEEETKLDSAADPSDIKLLVFEDGKIFFGGGFKNLEVVEAEESDIDRIKELKERKEDRREKYDKEVFNPYLNGGDE